MKYAVILFGHLAVSPHYLHKVQNYLQQSGLKPDHGVLLAFYQNDEQRSAFLSVPLTSQIRFCRISEISAASVLTVLKDYLADKNDLPLLIFPEGAEGCSCAIRLASHLNGTSLTGVQKTEIEGNRVSCIKPVYANYLQSRQVLSHAPYCLSVDFTSRSMERDHSWPTIQPEITSVDYSDLPMPEGIKQKSFEASDIFQDLDNARIAVTIGWGAGSRKNIEKISGLADILHAEWGVTRPVVMHAWAPQSRLIGISGQKIAPELCFVLGASGSAAFLAGISRSKYIIAINHDPDAPIHRYANVSFIGDCVSIFDEFVKILSSHRHENNLSSF